LHGDYLIQKKKLHPSDLFCDKNSSFFYKEKSQVTWSREFFGKFPKTIAIIRGIVFEIIKSFGEFEQISSFPLLKSPYLANAF
jgi:hypothetical protein